MLDSVLTFIGETNWYGEGGKKTNAAKAAFASIAAVPMLAVNTVGGILGGFASGALSGAAGGFVLGGAVGLDAGNSMGKNKASDPKYAKPVAAPVTPKPVEGSPTNSEASGAAAGGAEALPAPAPAAPAAPQTEAGQKIAAMMTKAKAVMRMSPEEQEADAAAECTRIAACKNAYEVLEIPSGATQAEVSKAHKAKSMAYHPDKNQSAKAKDVSQAANNAYTLLSDPEKRAKYDNSGFKDTSGVDLGEGVSVDIAVSKRSMAAGAVTGVLGGIAGLGLGAAAGVVGGALTGVIGTVAKAREMSLDSVPASVVMAERVAARRAALKKEEGKGGPGTVSFTSLDEGLNVQVDPVEGRVKVGLPEATMAIAAGVKAPAQGSGSTAITTYSPASSDLSISPFTLPSIQADLELVIGPRFLERYSRTAGSANGDRLFARKYAESVGEVAKFQRKQLGIPEPKTETGADADGHDSATDGHGEHLDATHDDRDKNEAKTISSVGGLLFHMSSEIGSQVEGARAVQESQVWAMLACRYEAWSRGKLADETYVIGRLRGIMGADEDEDKDEEKDMAADSAAGGASSSAGSTDKDKSDKSKAKTKPRPKPITDPDQALGTGMAGQDDKARGPFIVVEVAAVQNPALAASSAKAGAASSSTSSFFGRKATPAVDAAGSGRNDPGCGPWHVLYAKPAAEVASGGEAASSAAKSVDCGGLPLALLAEIPGGQGPSASAGAANGVRLKFRTYLAPNKPSAAAAAAGSMYGLRTSEVVLPREAVAAVAGRGNTPRAAGQ